MTFRLRYRLMRTHVYCRLFVGRGWNFAFAGAFTLRGDEFEALRESLDAEFVDDDAEASSGGPL